MVFRLRRGAGSAALAAGLGVAWLLHVAGGTQPPVFDGLPIPQEPYRYVSPPPELKSSNKPPLSGEATFPVQNGQVAGGGVQTDDAQVVVFFGLGAFQASSGATSVKIRVEPITDPPPPPPGAQLRGNVYRISAVELPAGKPVGGVSPFHLTMRFPPGPFKDIRLYDGQEWLALETNRPSPDPFAGAVASTLGEVAATAPAGAGGENIFALLARLAESYGLLAFILVFGIIAVLQEIRRRRRKGS